MNPIENEQICSSCAMAIAEGSGRLANVPALVKKIIAAEAWKERKIRTGKIVKLKSLRDLITLPPLDGWGEDPAKVEALIRDDAEALATWREAMTPPNHRPISNDNIISYGGQGTSRAYTLSRLRREQPKLFADVDAGKLSANAAAIKAGWRKKPTTIEQLKKLWSKASSNDKREFQRWIKGGQTMK